MQPDSQQQQPANPSIDYLNQIASPVPQKTLSPFVLWGAIGGGLMLVAIFLVVIFSGGTNNTERMTSIAARLSALQTITTEATDQVQSSEIRTLNSSLSLVLTNANRDSASAVSALSATTDEKNTTVKDIAAQTTELKSKLDDARLNAVFDRTYAREMAYYLKTLRADMSELYQSTSKQAVQDFLQKTDENLKPFVDDFAGYKGD